MLGEMTQTILACPMCMSGAGGKTLLAANYAIGALFVVLCGVLMAVFAFIIYLAKRARKFENENSEEIS